MKSLHTAIVVFLLGIFTQGISGSAMKMAECELTKDPAGTQDITGTVTFSQQDTDSDVSIMLDISGFSTTDGNPKHGFHIHKTGDISGGCGTTEGHYNPENVKHGAPDAAVRHVGDLGNIEENSEGGVKQTMTDSIVSLYGDQTVIGRAIVIHATEDDLGLLEGDEGSETTGNAGARLACCVIEETSGATIRYISPFVLFISLLITFVYKK